MKILKVGCKTRCQKGRCPFQLESFAPNVYKEFVGSIMVAKYALGSFAKGGIGSDSVSILD
jgi:hypothetical protein